MRKRVLRFSVSLFAVAVASTMGAPEASASGCPGNVVIDGSLACHHTGGSSCSACRYLCEDGKYHWWNMCNVE
jgi:hypothetical protein